MTTVCVKTPASHATRERRKLARIGLELAELIENFVESTAEYQPSFIRDLNKSIREAASGRGRRISSLHELA